MRFEGCLNPASRISITNNLADFVRTQSLRRFLHDRLRLLRLPSAYHVLDKTAAFDMPDAQRKFVSAAAARIACPPIRPARIERQFISAPTHARFHRFSREGVADAV